MLLYFLKTCHLLVWQGRIEGGKETQFLGKLNCLPYLKSKLKGFSKSLKLGNKCSILFLPDSNSKELKFGNLFSEKYYLVKQGIF